MNEIEFKELQEKHKCKECGYWNADYDCGHADENHEICGDFYIEGEIGEIVE